eukprot:11310773-Prorocentrum_lima.AAC.1
MDGLGRHALCCSRGGGHIMWHNALTKAWAEVVREVGGSSTRECVVTAWARPCYRCPTCEKQQSTEG